MILLRVVFILFAATMIYLYVSRVLIPLWSKPKQIPDKSEDWEDQINNISSLLKEEAEEIDQKLKNKNRTNDK